MGTMGTQRLFFFLVLGNGGSQKTSKIPLVSILRLALTWMMVSGVSPGLRKPPFKGWFNPHELVASAHDLVPFPCRLMKGSKYTKSELRLVSLSLGISSHNFITPEKVLLEFCLVAKISIPVFTSFNKLVKVKFPTPFLLGSILSPQPGKLGTGQRREAQETFQEALSAYEKVGLIKKSHHHPSIVILKRGKKHEHHYFSGIFHDFPFPRNFLEDYNIKQPNQIQPVLLNACQSYYDNVQILYIHHD